MTACVKSFTNETTQGTHEGYPTYVAIKVELDIARRVIKADM